MRRTIFMALVAALLLAPSARASDPIEVLRDCNDDGVLQGDYSTSELRKARGELPTDADEYSDCRDVLSRAIAAKTTSSSGGGSSNHGGGSSSETSTGGGGASTSGSSGGSATPTPTRTATPSPTPEPRATPVTPADYKAIEDAVYEGDDAVPVAGRDVSPLLNADIGRNGLPGPLLTALSLLGAAVLAGFLLPLRRRVARRRA